MDVARLQPPPQIAAPSSVSISPEQQTENWQLIQAVHAVNAAELFGKDTELTFSLDRTSRRALIRLVNRRTGKEIRRIPAEELLRLAVSLDASTED